MSRVVVDLGNSRMKWGLVQGDHIAEMVAHGYGEQSEWQAVFDRWQRPLEWSIASVAPRRTEQFQAWLSPFSIFPQIVTHEAVWTAFDHAGLKSRVEQRDRIGIDRLLAIRAAWERAGAAPIVVACLGTAMTIDFITADGVHEGGCILPGPMLMAKSLHDHTAALPLVDLSVPPDDDRIGRNTVRAIQTGITHAIVGAVDRILAEYSADCLMVTGGGARLFADVMLTHPVVEFIIEERLILEGLRMVTAS